MVVADAYPNFSICGIPYYVSGEVTHWRNLAHRTLDDLKATGMQVRLNTTATKIDVAGRRLHVLDEAGVEDTDRLRPTRRGDRSRLGPAAHRRPRRSRCARVRPTACTCSTPWATPSSSCAHSRRTSRPVQ